MKIVHWQMCILILLLIGLSSNRCYGKKLGEEVRDPVIFKQLQTAIAKDNSFVFLDELGDIIFSGLVELISIAWDYFMPEILNNHVNDVYSKISTIEQELAWLEYAVFYGEDIKTLNYLINKYNKDIQNSTGTEAMKWADVALSFDSDGFDKSLKDIGDMMEGTGSLFVKDSIFEAVGTKAESSEDFSKACITIQQTWDYLSGLWITGHAVWAQAFRIKNDSFPYNAAQKKNKAESKLKAFRAERDKSFLKRCYYAECYRSGLIYNWEEAENTLKNVSSASACNDACMTNEKCKVWTSNLEKKQCFNFADSDNATQSEDASFVSGPKVCPKCQPTCNSVLCAAHICGDQSCCRNQSSGQSSVKPNLLICVLILLCMRHLNLGTKITHSVIPDAPVFISSIL